MQGPGGPTEDTSGGFTYGGWTVPYFDEFSGRVMDEQMGHPFDLLLGKKTYDIWASYWPNHKEEDLGINDATKYVVTHTPFEPTWEKTVVISENVVEEIRKLKQQDGPEIQVQGSGNLIQTLLQHDLVDELKLKIFPIVLGTGKKLFAEGTVPMAFELEKSETSPLGVIIANYKRAGEVKTGSF